MKLGARFHEHGNNDWSQRKPGFFKKPGLFFLAVDPYTAEKCAQQTLDCDGQRFILVGPKMYSSGASD